MADTDPYDILTLNFDALKCFAGKVIKAGTLPPGELYRDSHFGYNVGGDFVQDGAAIELIVFEGENGLFVLDGALLTFLETTLESGRAVFGSRHRFLSSNPRFRSFKASGIELVSDKLQGAPLANFTLSELLAPYRDNLVEALNEIVSRLVRAYNQ